MNRIKELREARGINMKEAARMLCMPYTTYVNYEKGQREPTSETLIQIANFFNTSIDYLVGRCHNPQQASAPPVIAYASKADPELSVAEKDLLRKYRALDPAAKGRILNALDYEYNSIPGSTSDTAPKEA